MDKLSFGIYDEVQFCPRCDRPLTTREYMRRGICDKCVASERQFLRRQDHNKSYRKTHPRWGSKEHKATMKEKLTGLKRTPEQRQRMLEARAKMPQKDTLPERLMEQELKSNDIYYKKQVPLCNCTIVDFYLPQINTVIYVDGDYWHNYPHGLEKDRRQVKILMSNGFNVYRFWERDIKRDTLKCLKEVKVLAF